ncbi:MAG: pyridoxal phosphate-dependent aminotransferase [Firmicutes bacterium]|nr:pyridoxal phosphate-dependent aminotransferase [Bacillota bacterium]
MKYDFTTLVNRTGAGSGKWDQMRRECPDIPEDIVPLSVADMELRNAPELIEGLKEYLDQTILGYTHETDAYYEAVIRWMQRRHGFTPEREWFVIVPGIVPALYQMVKAYTAPGDSILITPPVYGPFYSAVTENGRHLVESPLILHEQRYDIDWEDLEAKAADPGVTLMILCSPHNPIGRIWTREELLRLSEICLRHHVYLISDEIHHDLIMPGESFVSVGTLPEAYRMNASICTAPSKTFNLAGLQASNLFVPDPVKRGLLESAQGYSSLNIFGYKACELAYNRCEAWLDELLLHVAANRDYVREYVAEHLPMIQAYPMQATYLLWLDFRALGMDADALRTFLHQKAYCFLTDGTFFGKEGAGFGRMNLACPRFVLENTLERLTAAIRALS